MVELKQGCDLMGMQEGLLIVIVVLLILLLILVLKGNSSKAMMDELSKMKQDLNNSTSNQVNSLGLLLNDGLKNNNESQTQQMSELNRQVVDSQRALLESVGKISLEMEERMHKLNDLNTATGELQRKQLSESTLNFETRIKDLVKQNDDRLEQMRQTIETKMTNLQVENNRKLDEMRNVVDEKLQETLENRISKSFQLVSERLEQVYRGLGEMQSLASGVGDLKRVLTNVKTKGILGEIQCGAILEEILAPEQYEKNVNTKKGSRNVVEFAVKLPYDGNTCVYLPIDSKFPSDPYFRLMDAYDLNDPVLINAAVKQLETAIKVNAKDIHDKYIDVPNTTEFAIMFLPFEGLYAEVVRRGLLETLQREYRINIAGPTTLAALLNSLQMGFKTLAIQKRTSEVWEVLGSVKSEFDKFATVLESTQSRLDLAQKELDKLVGVRTRQIQKKLSTITGIETKSEVAEEIDE